MRSLPKALTHDRHQCNPTVKNAPAFVFDWMEPRAAEVDRAVLGFVKGLVFDPADFAIRNDGFAG